MRFNINLATKTYIDAKMLRFWTLLAVVLLSLLLVYNVRSIATNAAKLRRLANEIAASDSKAGSVGKSVPEKEYQRLLERIGFANSVIEKKAYDWIALLDRLEQVVPDGVAISSIEPDPKNERLRLSGVAKNFTNLRIFMERLEDSKFFTDLYLMSQGNVKLGDVKQSGNASEGITFSLTCRVAMK